MATAQSNYLPITLDAIRPNCPFTFDLYIKVNEKFLLYIKKGEGIEGEKLEKMKQIQKLREKAVDRIFVTVEDHKAFEDFIDDEIEEATESEEMPAEEKFEVIQEIAQTAVEVVFTDPTSQKAYALTEKAAQGLRKVVADNPGALKNLYQKKGKDTNLIETHCKNVAALALKLAFAMGKRGKDLDNLGAAALIHDLGLTKLPAAEFDVLFKRPADKMSPDDKRIYQPHVQYGQEMIKDKKFINPEIINLVMKHEEKNGEKGYPEKVKKLDLMEEILSLVNCFDKKVTVFGMNPIKAFKEIQTNEIGNYNLKTIKKFKEVLTAEQILK